MKSGDLIFDIEPLEKRAKGIQEWLDKNGRGCQEEQKHIRAGTVEKIYWHYGYMVALMDVLRFLGREITTVASSEHSHTQKPDRYN
jgi:hypothetical protein